MFSLDKLSIAVCVGANNKLEMWSVSILFCSSGIAILKLLSPASTWATGINNLLAHNAPAKVEFVSPYTKTISGFSFKYISSRAINMLPVWWPWLEEPILKL